jgi:hypothetical protein
VFLKKTLTPTGAASLRQQELLARFTRAVHRAVGEWGYLRECGSFRSLAGLFADRADEVFFDWCHVGGAANGELAAEMIGEIRRGLDAGSEPLAGRTAVAGRR